MDWKRTYYTARQQGTLTMFVLYLAISFIMSLLGYEEGIPFSLAGFVMVMLLLVFSFIASAIIEVFDIGKEKTLGSFTRTGFLIGIGILIDKFLVPVTELVMMFFSEIFRILFSE